MISKQRMKIALSSLIIVGALGLSIFAGYLIVETNVGLFISEDDKVIHESDVAYKPQLSFALVTANHELSLINCIPGPGAIPCNELGLDLKKKVTMVSRGSGAVIGHGKNETYAITAAHVCTENPVFWEVKGNHMFVFQIKVTLALTDYYGNERDASILEIDEANDICILRSEGIWSRPLKIAKKMSKRGEKVTTMSAPRSIYYPGMVLVFDGYYTGNDDRGNRFFTTPTAPGSSGSVILNRNNEIISVIHSAMRSFESVGLGCSLENIHAIVNKSLIKN